jgi:hypothetical protein
MCERHRRGERPDVSPPLGQTLRSILAPLMCSFSEGHSVLLQTWRGRSLTPERLGAKTLRESIGQPTGFCWMTVRLSDIGF